MLFRDSTKETGAEATMRENERVFPNNPAPAPSQIIREAAAAAAVPAPMPALKPTTAPAAAIKESVFASELTIEGKIEGTGHVRMAGRFKGDVQVKGNVSVEQGAVVTGEIKADVVIISGQVDGNIDATTRVELQPSGVLNGDVKAGTLTVAAGSRMRGRVEFGWSEKA